MIRGKYTTIHLCRFLLHQMKLTKWKSTLGLQWVNQHSRYGSQPMEYKSISSKMYTIVLQLTKTASTYSPFKYLNKIFLVQKLPWLNTLKPFNDSVLPLVHTEKRGGRRVFSLAAMLPSMPNADEFSKTNWNASFKYFWTSLLSLL